MNREEYIQEFDLGPQELKLRLLDCSVGRQEDPNLNIVFIDPKKTLPKLSFDNESFDLALCGDYLFAGNETLTDPFHVQALIELARVATEVRVVPIVDKQGQPSKHLGPVLQVLQEQGFGVEVRQVKSTTQNNGHPLLRVWNEACKVKT